MDSTISDVMGSVIDDDDGGVKLIEPFREGGGRPFKAVSKNVLKSCSRSAGALVTATSRSSLPPRLKSGSTAPGRLLVATIQKQYFPTVPPSGSSSISESIQLAIASLNASWRSLCGALSVLPKASISSITTNTASKSFGGLRDTEGFRAVQSEVEGD